MTADEMKPGITILVPAGADLVRPRHPYRLRITEVYKVSDDGELISVTGRLQRLDGTPTHRRNHKGRYAVLPLAELTIAEG